MTPALEISLKESLKTMMMGKITNTAISRMLGSSQRYGSHLFRFRGEYMVFLPSE